MNKVGFSLLELMVAIVLIGLMAAIVVPRLTKKGPKEEREKFIQNINVLTRHALKNAITNQKNQRIEFDFSPEKRIIFVTESSGKKDQEGKELFQPIKKSYSLQQLKIPSHFSFKNFYVEGFDEFSKAGSGRNVTGVWFFIVPDGLSQSVIINFVDTKERRVAGKLKSIGLVLNSFSAQFKAYDTFKKP
ncbi:type II secretion system protein [bacterium]|nr:type II secretion system protein [bacterium]